MREWRIRHQPELTAVAFAVAFGLLAYGAWPIIAVAVASALPITGGRITPAFLWQGVFAWAAAGTLLAAARLDAPQGAGS